MKPTITEQDATMMAFCIWRGIYETKRDSDDIVGFPVDNPLAEDLELTRIALEMVKPEYIEIMKGTLAITIQDIREGRIL